MTIFSEVSDNEVVKEGHLMSKAIIW